MGDGNILDNPDDVHMSFESIQLSDLEVRNDGRVSVPVNRKEYQRELDCE